ncbi:taste receptor type 2 member 4-like [Pelodytes ibericus]
MEETISPVEQDYYITVVASTLSFIQFAGTITVNAFIVAVNLMDRLRGRQIKACDKILCSLAISRMGFQSFSFFKIYIVMSIPSASWSSMISAVITFCEFAFSYTSLWFVALLSVVYLVKIANYKHSLFLILKTMVLKRLTLSILATAMISLFKSCIISLSLYYVANVNSTSHDYPTNNTCHHERLDIYFSVDILGNCLPLIICGASSVLILTSLCLHMKQMRNGFTASHLDSYYVAIQSVAVCFIISCLHIGTNIAFIFCFNSINYFWMQILLNFFPTLHSSYLVYVTPNLRQQFTHLIQRRANCRISRGEVGTELQQPTGDHQSMISTPSI